MASRSKAMGSMFLGGLLAAVLLRGKMRWDWAFLLGSVIGGSIGLVWVNLMRQQKKKATTDTTRSRPAHRAEALRRSDEAPPASSPVWGKSNPHPVMSELYTCYVQQISGNLYNEEQQLERCAELLMAHPTKNDGIPDTHEEARKAARLLFNTMYYLTRECGLPQPVMVSLLQSVTTVQDFLQFQLYEPTQIQAMIRQ